MTHTQTGGGAPARTSDRVRAKPSSSWHDDWSDAHAQTDSMKSQGSIVFIPPPLSPANSWIASLCSSLHDSSTTTRSEASTTGEWLSRLPSLQQDTGLAWESNLPRVRDEDGTLHRGRRGSSRAHHQHHHPYQLSADAGISLDAMPAGPFQASAVGSVDTTQNTEIEFTGGQAGPQTLLPLHFPGGIFADVPTTGLFSDQAACLLGSSLNVESFQASDQAVAARKMAIDFGCHALLPAHLASHFSGGSFDATQAKLLRNQATCNHDVQVAAQRVRASRLNVDARQPHGEDPNDADDTDDAGLTLGPGDPWRVRVCSHVVFSHFQYRSHSL
jgi:hypothetical protein